MSSSFLLRAVLPSVDRALMSLETDEPLQPTNFTPGQRMPTSVVLNHKEGVWLIDSDKTEELAEKNVLTWMVSVVNFQVYPSISDALQVVLITAI